MRNTALNLHITPIQHKPPNTKTTHHHPEVRKMVKQLNNKIMTKQEFLAMSLPYELKCMIRMADRKTLTMYDFDSYQYHYRGCHKKFESTFPILHPLSDLTKEIEYNGYAFVPISKIIDDERRDSNLEHLFRMIINLNMYELIFNLPYWAIQKLVEWHFDIAGLIEKGEAIDININTIEGFNY